MQSVFWVIVPIISEDTVAREPAQADQMVQLINIETHRQTLIAESSELPSVRGRDILQAVKVNVAVKTQL